MRILLIWVSLVAVNGGWGVRFDPHPNNVAVTLVTECEQFFAFNRHELEPGDSNVWFVRADAGNGAYCVVRVGVVRRPADRMDDPTAEYVAEWTSASQ
jgi:hypothetical protein